MERTCARALELGLRSLAFTEHVDLTPWALHGATVPADSRGHMGSGTFLAGALDVYGYLECVHRCRALFPDLEVLSGLELSEPHLYPAAISELLSGGEFDRVLGSVHSLVDLDPDPNSTPTSTPTSTSTQTSRSTPTPISTPPSGPPLGWKLAPPMPSGPPSTWSEVT